MENSAAPDQLASDLDLHCLQRRVYLSSAGQGLRTKKDMAYLWICKLTGDISIHI